MKKRILYVGNKSGVGNATITTIDTLSEQLKIEGFKLITTSSKKNKAWRLLDMLNTVYKYRNETDIVLIDTYSTLNFKYAVAVASLCRKFNIPYIPILHGGNLPERLKKSPKASTKLFQKSKVNVAPSSYLLEAFKAEGYHNTMYIPNTIKIENYPFLQREIVTAKLLWVRSFSKIYNPQLAIDVLKQLVYEGVQASLTMVGPEKDGSQDHCIKYAEQYNLKVNFTGKLTKNQWIEESKKHDIFINTTNFDNMPVSVIEAMALGLPVVSTNVGGLPHLIKNNETGILIKPNSITDFVIAIKNLMSENDKAVRLSINARNYSELFDWQQVKEKWVSILKD
ncbi:1,2-diacylglycerol 3-glucosyltransferase [Patiriisocius marinistellae]|uniref:1,2-diacylglycerol 3-glucosyltransferase n=1 Tax=Patiriisocius marinistellae TaxID=2494560 RepID=A0A5J4G2H0_9FLAO|nr:glycosyltransferase [Patiriisocius marinistellae]GEQ86795.1 1,2-diacylglycerol 3-glucosyltransferase [Patiriisocius marinistellae]